MEKNSIALLLALLALSVYSLTSFADQDNSLSQKNLKTSSSDELPIISLSESQPYSPASHKEFKALKYGVPTKAAIKEAANAVAVDEIDFSQRMMLKRPTVFKFDPIAQALTYKEEHSKSIDPEDLSENVKAATEHVPDWLYNQFMARIWRLSDSKRERLADAINGNTDARLDDEIAYTVAYSSVSDLLSGVFKPEMLVENAAGIYAIADELPYVEIVELEDRTTLKYKYIEDEVEGQWQLPADIYYEYVVHPRLDHEDIGYINPANGVQASPPAGAFWRDYYLNTDEPPRSYTAHRIIEVPNDLHGESFPAISMPQSVYLSDWEIGPVDILKLDDGKPVASVFVFGDNSGCSLINPPDGEFLVSVVPLEQIARDGDTRLLENMLTYRSHLRSLNLSGSPVYILQERDPFGSKIIEETLTGIGMAFETYSMSEILELDLHRKPKVIIPSDQPRSFYEALTTNHEFFENYVNGGGTLEFHGYVTATEDRWDDLRMPGGFSATWSEDGAATVIESGWPELLPILKSTQYVWDMQTYQGLPGTRLYDKDSFAFEKIGWWASQMLPYNVQEWSCTNASSTERSVQAVRITNNHYGNCGEIQDISGATARAALIPAALVQNNTEDHVWLHFYFKDQWIPFQFDWSDSATRINNFGISYEKDTGGGGKDCACINQCHGDGRIDSVIDLYSNSITLNIQLTDADGYPVDGAIVKIATEMWSSTDLTIGFWGVTDADGRFSVKLGENQNYYVRVESTLGVFPNDGETVTQVISAENALADEVFNWSHQFETSLGFAGGSAKNDEAMGDRYLFELSAGTSEPAFVIGKNAYNGKQYFVEREIDASAVTGVLLSEDQLNEFINKGNYEYTAAFENGSMEIPSSPFPAYIVLFPRYYATELNAEGTLSVAFIAGTEEPVDGDLENESEIENEVGEDGDADTTDTPDNTDDIDGDLSLDGDDELSEYSETGLENMDDDDGGCSSSQDHSELIFALLFLSILTRKRKLFSN